MSLIFPIEKQQSYRVFRVSIVVYAPDMDLLKRAIISLIIACKNAIEKKLIDRVEICLIDNGPVPECKENLHVLLEEVGSDAVSEIAFTLMGSGENIGFGAGHNLALDSSSCEFHLVLNPDVELDVAALVNALTFMCSNAECGMLSPSIVNGRGESEYPCKRYPALLDLALRGFAPLWLRDLFKRRLSAYEMRDQVMGEPVWDPPIVSGCFMLLRSSSIAATKGFDPRFFLYFEDFDLSLRVAEISRIAYVPSVKIVHHGGNAAKKGWRHIMLFSKSAFLFFNKHGWKFV